MEEEINKYRKKLIEYTNISINEKDISTRQKEAIEKMVFLNQTQFKELLEDITYEIDRRVNNYIEIDTNLDQNRNNSRRKLKILNEPAFKNLVIDVLLVIEHRMPLFNTKTSMNSLVNEVENILKSLKMKKSLEELIEFHLNKKYSFSEKMSCYLKYFQQKFEENKFPLQIIERFKVDIDFFSEDLFEKQTFSLLNFDQFLNFCQKLKIENLEFNFRLKKLLEKKEEDLEDQEDFVKREIAELFYLIIKDKEIFENKKNVYLIKEDANKLMDSIEMFVSSLKSKSSIDFNDVTKDLLSSSELFYYKIKDKEIKVDKYLVNKYLQQHNKIKEAVEEKSGCLFTSVIEFVYFVKEIFVILGMNEQI